MTTLKIAADKYETIATDADNRAHNAGRIAAVALRDAILLHGEGAIKGLNYSLESMGYTLTTTSHLKDMEDGCAVACKMGG